MFKPLKQQYSSGPVAKHDVGNSFDFVPNGSPTFITGWIELPTSILVICLWGCFFCSISVWDIVWSPAGVCHFTRFIIAIYIDFFFICWVSSFFLLRPTAQHSHTHAHTHIYIYIYMCLCACVYFLYMYVHVSVYVCVCACVSLSRRSYVVRFEGQWQHYCFYYSCIRICTYK